MLRDLLAARPAMSGALVRLHLPTRVPKQNDRVYIVGTESLERVYVTQQGELRETYLLVLLVESKRNGTDPTPAADRLWSIVDEIDSLLEDDPEIGGTVTDSHLSAIPAENTLPLSDNNGWLARAEVHVTVEAII